jgi:regulator of replication initiation timing|tara:strand:+ start:481 stop:678 length:198 start_codon:yes stop_codon:yes gene_type:complete
MDNNLDSNCISIDRTIDILHSQINKLKSQLEMEREEHRSIYLKVKLENEELQKELNYIKGLPPVP